MEQVEKGNCGRVILNVVLSHVDKPGNHICALNMVLNHVDQVDHVGNHIDHVGHLGNHIDHVGSSKIVQIGPKKVF